MIVGHDSAVAQFKAAWDSRALHHAWLLAGPKGVGKAHFAKAAAVRVLAEAAGPPVGEAGLGTSEDHPMAKLVAAGSHPDMRVLQRVANEKTGNLNRNIKIDQVRALGEFIGLSPALSDWRVVVIDSVDDLERSAANALLKMLEEPPPQSLFLLVSHSPGRLLPTIRSRCRRLELRALESDAMTSILGRQLPEMKPDDLKQLIALSNGSAGRALAFASLGLAPLQLEALAILREGDSDNSKRSMLANELGRKGAADRYAAFLDLLPSLVAGEARRLEEPRRRIALETYDRVRELSALAPRLSLDPAATVFQLGGMLARVAEAGFLEGQGAAR